MDVPLMNDLKSLVTGKVHEAMRRCSWLTDRLTRLRVGTSVGLTTWTPGQRQDQKSDAAPDSPVARQESRQKDGQAPGRPAGGRLTARPGGGESEANTMVSGQPPMLPHTEASIFARTARLAAHPVRFVGQLPSSRPTAVPIPIHPPTHTHHLVTTHLRQPIHPIKPIQGPPITSLQHHFQAFHLITRKQLPIIQLVAPLSNTQPTIHHP
ncbi:hypothetical protein F4780DRAFT_416677 [Xylariomycetidae sp. FL0641]|nr:hypothetical protein F4780DRAFT_416677 [Xylariomycetidae sp. FL0641]